MKDKIQFAGSLVVIAIVLVVYEMALSGEFNFTDETAKELPSIFIKSTLFGYIKLYGRSLGKKWARKTCNALIVTVKSLWNIKNWITANKQTKAFGKHIENLNYHKRLSLAQKRARSIIEKDNDKIARLTRAIKVREVNKKPFTKFKNKKLILETKVKEFSKLWENKKLDKAAEALMYKLTKKYKLVSQSAIFVQTPNKFERYDVTTSDIKGSMATFGQGIIVAILTFVVLQSMVLEAGRANNWETWIALIMILIFGFLNLFIGIEQGKKVVENKELPTRMNALAVGQEFADEVGFHVEQKEKD